MKTDEEPMKVTETMFSKNKKKELFSYEQTEPIKWELIEGKLPSNEYGNIELFSC